MAVPCKNCRRVGRHQISVEPGHRSDSLLSLGFVRTAVCVKPAPLTLRREKTADTIWRPGSTYQQAKTTSQSVSRFSGRKGLKNPETDWDDNPGKPMLVIPVHFGVFWPKRRLGFPGLSSAACPNSRKKASKRPLVARSQKAASFNSNSHIGKPLVCRGPESRQKASQRPPATTTVDWRTHRAVARHGAITFDR